MEEKKEHIIAKWLEGSISDAELETHYDTDMSNDLRLIKDATDDLTVPAMNSDALLRNIKADIHKPSTAKVFYLKYWVSAIAAILIGVLVYTTVMDQSIDVYNDTLIFATHSLPDGSTIKLNANSHIEYDQHFVDNRVIYLSGEAFFEVQKGETFTVHTDNGDIRVLGTSFNVFSRSDNLQVACKTGKVKVVSQSEYILGPGDNVIFVNGQLIDKGSIDIEQIATWQQGESKFKSSPISIVLLAMKAQYNYEIKGVTIDLTQKFTGNFVHDDIDKAVRMVFLPMGISYKLDAKNKIIQIQ